MDGTPTERILGNRAVIEPVTYTGVRAERSVRVEYRISVADDWGILDNAVALSAEIHSGATGYQKGEIALRYGSMVPERGSAYVTRDPQRFVGAWIRLVMLPAPERMDQWGSGDDSELLAMADAEAAAVNPYDVIFQGFVVAQMDAPHNVGLADTPRGDQILIVAGLDRLLDQIQFTNTVWPVSDGTFAALDRMDGFNVRLDDGRISGNRSALSFRGAHYFGGALTWNHAQMVQYLLAAHVQVWADETENNPVWPIWTVSGQVDALEQITSPVEFGDRETVRSLLDRIIHPSHGLDYVLDITDDGVSVYVFSLQKDAIAAAGYVLPANPNTFALDLTDVFDVAVSTEESLAQAYDRIRIVGAPIVMCLSAGSVYAANAKQTLWTAAAEAAYRVALGDPLDESERAANDAYRAAAAFNDVFSAFGLVHGNWQGGAAYPMCRDDGELVFTDVPYTTSGRVTRAELPLATGYDYTTDPPTWVGNDATAVELRPPMAWVEDPQTTRIVRTDALAEAELGSNITPRALPNQWGVRVKASPNYVLARNHWLSEGDTYPGKVDPDYDLGVGLDYSTLGFTIAIELDHRVQMAAELPIDEQWGQGLELVIRAPEIQLWCIAPNTVVDVDDDGPVLSPADTVVIRDDRDQLARILAGAISRYTRARRRATVHYTALEPLAGAIGSILETVQTGGISRAVNAAVTTVSWDFRNRTTTMNTGQSQA